MNTNMLSSQLESMKAKINERRKSIEQIRSFNVRRLQTDVKKISKQEVEFTKKFLEEIIPIKVMWNENAAKQLKDMLPFTVEFTAFKNNMEEKDDPELQDEAMEAGKDTGKKEDNLP